MWLEVTKSTDQTSVTVVGVTLHSVVWKTVNGIPDFQPENPGNVDKTNERQTDGCWNQKHQGSFYPDSLHHFFSLS